MGDVVTMPTAETRAAAKMRAAVLLRIELGHDGMMAAKDAWAKRSGNPSQERRDMYRALALSSLGWVRQTRAQVDAYVPDGRERIEAKGKLLDVATFAVEVLEVAEGRSFASPEPFRVR